MALVERMKKEGVRYRVSVSCLIIRGLKQKYLLSAYQLLIFVFITYIGPDQVMNKSYFLCESKDEILSIR